MLKTILVCTDGSDSARHAAEAAAQLALRYDSRVLLLHVFDTGLTTAPYNSAWQMIVGEDTMEHTARKTHEAVLRRTMHVFEKAGVSCQPMHTIGHPVEKVIEAARLEQAELIVMGSRGIGGWKAMLLGSVSNGVLHHAHCPTLIVRGEKPLIFRQILLATDGSRGASAATRMAVSLTRKFKAKLDVVSVFEPLEKVGIVSPEAPEPKIRTLRDLERLMLGDGSAPVEAEALYTLWQEIGNPAETILRVATECRSDLILIGSRGMGAFKAQLLGSVSDRVMNHAPCSVLIAR